MDLSRIKYLREALDEEALDLMEIAEIEEAFNEIPVDELRDLPENATVGDMLDELEERCSDLEHIIYDWVADNFGESEANDPSWSIGQLALHIEEELNNRNYREDVRQGRVDV